MLGRRQNTVGFRARQTVDPSKENAHVAPGKAAFGKPLLGKAAGGAAGVQTRARAALGDRSNTFHTDNAALARPPAPPPAKKEAAENMETSLAAKARRMARTAAAVVTKTKPEAKKETAAGEEDMEVDEPTTVAMEEELMEEVEVDENLSLADRVFRGRAYERDAMREMVVNAFTGGMWQPGPTSVDRITNPDITDSPNTQMVAQYVYDIFDYMQDLELQRMPLKPNFLEHCHRITARMRYVLVDWMVQIHSRFEMLPETLYVAIGMMDRFCMTPAGVDINKDNLQLVGVTAMMVAAKFEEMYPPDVTDFTYVTGNAYTARQLTDFEWTLLDNIGFFCTIPTPITFLRRFSRLIQATGEMHSAAKYFIELSASEYALCHYPACLRAAAAICLSIALVKYSSTMNGLQLLKNTCDDADLSNLMRDAYLPNIQFTAAYSINDIIPVARKIANVVLRQSNPSKYRSIYRKYVSPEVHAVALRPEFQSQLLASFADDSM